VIIALPNKLNASNALIINMFKKMVIARQKLPATIRQVCLLKWLIILINVLNVMLLNAIHAVAKKIPVYNVPMVST